MRNTDTSEKFRIDKWLFAARFFKTRSLAAEAIERGRVHLNGSRVKPAKTLVTGDRIIIRIGNYQYDIEVLALSRVYSEIQRLFIHCQEKFRHEMN
ncbi:ribosome-associated heat shock protein Hsp15 [Nitrosomonas aestuarii]|uniref:Ribosome-associated heat shock protein Hsp15 n=1 Tax=Nitrosomonas aestuarii TaxID=52441 RepID=A0A1I4HP01_9PROT|nr:ribosome-associated heat shock protein Hsp15 [Nitrosomonas aestuarii]